MFSRLVGSMLRRSIRALNAGDIRPALNAYADDAVVVFPGDSSFGATYRGKAEIERFLRQFVAYGLRLDPGEIIVKGMPWNMRIVLLCTDASTARLDGEPVYANRVAIYCRARWGKIVYEEDYLDTQKVSAYDAYLSAREASATPA